ncbi:glycine zipper 2TM domain-containing protein [Azoarcus sp. L1K30]|uniref:glycine zipper 2TM domain-containing protein n=1 Tax=Azoarcus sp. L1K30 TaxID=2820277 RepID=UPI001B81DB39|nr:glycine zipper 2TM domain-containing protein [Azoarcus sp. L1K30]MBR0566860.1 glycine zipper 2TM domain-containing protein [Azoarcus sp. L1K30]
MSRPTPAAVPRVEASPPAGTGLVQGTLAGAVVGAAVSNPHHAGDGALVGAVVGAVAGASSDAARQARAERMEEAYAHRAATSDQTYSEAEDRYRRAIEACLDGRGYRVQSSSR